MSSYAETTSASDPPEGSQFRPGYDPRYFETRLVEDPHRAAIWRHLTAYFSRWIPADADVLELGAGWCDFANNVTARRVVALDLDPTVQDAAAAHVEPVVGDCSDLSQFEPDSFDVVFASNLLEHLTREQANQLLDSATRVLRPGGRLMLMQPNFRLSYKRYFDDYTHVAVFTDVSMRDYLTSRGYQVENVFARFMPFTMKSSAANLSFLVPWYLRSPIKPMAGQMLAIATPGAGR